MRKLGSMVFVLFVKVTLLLNSIAGILRFWKILEILLSLVLSSCGLHPERNLDSRSQHRSRHLCGRGVSWREWAAVWGVSGSRKQDWEEGVRKGSRCRVSPSPLCVTSFPGGDDSFPQIFTQTCLCWLDINQIHLWQKVKEFPIITRTPLCSTEFHILKSSSWKVVGLFHRTK